MILWLKALHIVAVISWMAGLLYLPRLFVYHAGLQPKSEASELLKVMELRLLRYIMAPASIVTWLTGPLLAYLTGHHNDPWLMAKFALVIALTFAHHQQARWRKDFAADANTRDAKFYRIMNEVPTLLMVLIVILVVLKPF